MAVFTPLYFIVTLECASKLECLFSSGFHQPCLWVIQRAYPRLEHMNITLLIQTQLVLQSNIRPGPNVIKLFSCIFDGCCSIISFFDCHFYPKLDIGLFSKHSFSFVTYEWSKMQAFIPGRPFHPCLMFDKTSCALHE